MVSALVRLYEDNDFGLSFHSIVTPTYDAVYDIYPDYFGDRRKGAQLGTQTHANAHDAMKGKSFPGNGARIRGGFSDVNQDTGVVRTKRIVVAQDTGPISSPDGLRNQLEGGALQGLSRALGEEVTWDDQKITSIDWATYKTLYVGSNTPVIESVLIDRPDSEAMGAGETAITIVAAAVGNAIYDATGVRIRQIPFTPERVKAALAQRAGNQTAQV